MRTLQNTLRRQTFTVSREAEYFTRDELERQTGYSPEMWFPEVIAKELLDNCLDGCESVSRTPEIAVTLDAERLEVRDNGPGIKPSVVRRILDFTTRTSDKQAYVSPTRGAQGNALKSVVGMVYVLGGGDESVEIESQGVRHRISVEKDLAGKPEVVDETTPIVRNEGTTIRIPALRCASQADANRFQILQKLVFEYVFFNPHAEIKLNGELVRGRINAELRKWRSYDPPCGSVWWYDADRFEQLVRAYVAAEQRSKKPPITVRGFVAMFDRLTLTAKQKRVIERTKLKGELLRDLVIDGKKLDSAALEALRAAMRAESKPVKPRALGLLGEPHFRGLLSDRATGETFRYAREMSFDEEGLPFVVEAGFAIVEQTNATHHLHVGLNFAVPPGAMGRQLGERREVIPGLEAKLATARIDVSDSRVAIVVHLAHPRFHFHDRGKSHVQLDPVFHTAVWKAVDKVTQMWARIKKVEDRERTKELARLKRQYFVKPKKEHKPTFAELLPQYLPAAYALASGDGRFRPTVRQVYYRLRHPLSKAAGKTGDEEVSHHYFSQELLPEYVAAHPEETKSWRIIYDERGHLTEPHSGVRIGIGTVSVEKYVEMFAAGAVAPDDLPADAEELKISVPVTVSGPGRSYGTVLYIEKEGFDDQIWDARIPERYDLALASSKGLSSVALRNLFVALAKVGIRMLVLRDFDERGFIIAGTLSQDTKRYQFKEEERPEVVDLGLRLADAQRWKLESESVTYQHDPEKNLLKYGATEKEIAFLRRGRIDGSKKKCYGERIELNAFTCEQFAEWLEAKLEAAGVEKVLPADDVIKPIYLQARQARLDFRRKELQIRLDARCGARQAKLEAKEKTKREKLRARIHGRVWRAFMEEHGREMARLDAAVDQLDRKAQRRIKSARKLTPRTLKSVKATAPRDLRERVRADLQKHREDLWTAAISRVEAAQSLRAMRRRSGG